MVIEKQGKSKAELLKCLENLKSSFSKEIIQYNLEITQIENGYRLKGNKKFVFVNFSVDMTIIAEDGKFNLEYQTKNVPQSKIDEAIIQIKKVLENC